MFRIVRAAAFAWVALAALAAAQQAIPALLSQAVAATQAAKADYAFDVEIDSSARNFRARFNPTATPRLTLVQPRREELKSDERRAFDRMAENMEGVSWCASENISRANDVRLVREDDASVVYSFQPNAATVRGEQARRFSNRLRGELTLLKGAPDVTRIRIYTPEAFSPMPLVRVERLNILITCHTAPNGRRYAAETTTDIQGSALGQRIDERSVQRARNLSAP